MIEVSESWMRTDAFDFGVPREMIAQEPIEPRDSSRLLVLDRKTGKVKHKRFYDLPSYLEKGDALVFNNSRVIPARLKGHLDSSPMEGVTVVLLRQLEKNLWEALVEVGEAQPGDVLDFTLLSAKVIRLGELIGKRKETLITLRLSDESNLEDAGEPPVPPYIHSYKGDPERYQTVYSKIRGSAAAPTAGLHFTDRLLDELREKGVTLCFVTLHVGVDTFMPVYEEDPKDHKMYTEFYQVDPQVIDILEKTRKNGNRVVGVGTTSIRTLETVYRDGPTCLSGWTSLYILPGYEFKSIDSMITNFHYPRSTNLMMIAAFAGFYELRRAYQDAVRNKYRFYSFGDSMLII